MPHPTPRSVSLSALGISVGNGVTLLGSGMGFLLLAQRFGLSAEMDGFWAAMPLPVLLGQVPTGLAWSVLIPGLASLLATGAADEAWSVLTAYGLVLGLALGVIGVGLFLAAPMLMAWLAPGLTASEHEHATLVLRLLLPYGSLMAVAGTLAAALNAYRSFLVPALVGASSAWGGVVGLLATDESFGPAGYIFGITGGSMLTVAIELVLVAGLRPTPGAPPDLRHPRLRAMWRSAPPVMVARAADQVPPLVLRSIASVLGPGSVSAVGLAGVLVQPPTLAAAALAGVLFPGWAAEVATGDSLRFERTLSSVSRVVAWALGGLALIGTGISPLIAAVALRTPDQALAAACFAAVLLGAPALGVNYLLGAAYWAMGAVHRRVALELGFVVLTALLALGLSRVGAPGLLAAQSLGFLALATVGWRVLPRSRPPGHGGLDHYLLATTLVAGLGGALAYAVASQITVDAGWLRLAAGLVALGGLGAVAYVAASFVLGLPEARRCWELLRPAA